MSNSNQQRSISQPSSDWVTNDGKSLMQQAAINGAVQTKTTRGIGDAVVFVYSPRHGAFSVPFNFVNDAVSYATHVNPRSMSYIAVVDVSQLDNPNISFERSFHHG